MVSLSYILAEVSRLKMCITPRFSQSHDPMGLDCPLVNAAIEGVLVLYDCFSQAVLETPCQLLNAVEKS